MKGLGSGALNYIIFLFNIYLTYAEKYNGPVYRSSYWRYRNASGTLYGLEYYMGTKLYSRNPAKEPAVCFNAYDLKEGKYGYFICPPPNKHISYTTCCGERNKQDCCRPPATPAGFALIFGFIGGLVFVCVGGVTFCIKCGDRCCRGFEACCSSMVECFTSLYNSSTECIGSIGNCCRRQKHDSGGPPVVEVPEMEGMRDTETHSNKPNLEYGNQHEIQPLNVLQEMTRT